MFDCQLSGSSGSICEAEWSSNKLGVFLVDFWCLPNAHGKIKDLTLSKYEWNKKLEMKVLGSHGGV